MRATSTRLSKSRFCYGLQCPRQLWWRVHEANAPELQVDPALQAVFDRGHRVGEAARERFPGGVLVDAQPWEVAEKVEQTRRALADGAPVVYEASFLEGDVFVAVDVLERRGKSFRLYEVKSTLDVKDAHLPDVAIQTHVLRRAGLTVDRAHVLHLNRDCRHPDLSNLFVASDVTADVETLLPAIPQQVDSLQRMLAGPLPDADAGDRCTTPYDCPFSGRCLTTPEPDDVSQLHGLRAKRIAELLARGIQKVGQLPDDFELPATTRRQVESLRSGRLVVEEGLAHAIAAIATPAAFLDFETAMPAIPAWSGCSPYGQVPVQLSCHVLGRRGELTHHAHLAESGRDPRPEIAAAVVVACRGASSVVAYNASFERRCLCELAAAVPGLARELHAISAKLVDLLPIVRDHVYHPAFGGSFSIKAVLPALVPGLGYGDLEIASGDVASAALETLLLAPDSLAASERNALRRRLLAYCERDTLAMVRLYERLEDLAHAGATGR